MTRYSYLLLICILYSCKKPSQLFRQVRAEQSGIHFSNIVKESPELNILNYEYMYNGGGVGIGDFNHDSLPDIYFTGNLVPNKLYLNKGNLQFEDITDAAGVSGNGKWCKGVSIIDINQDGWDDIYVCAAVLPDSNARRNLLYVNQGLDKQTGKPIFKDLAAEYGLDDASNTHMAAFFDYDNDGDLDVYLLINDLDGTYPNEFRPIRTDGSWPNTDKLLQNNWDSTKGHGVYSDVSNKAGILIEGHGLGVNITDINQDGWKDIYVSNDYISNNILYINNHDGTFTDQCAKYFKHSSKNAMGNDIADINNDGLMDIVEMDMMPADRYRQKMMYNDISYQTYQNFARFGYMHQYARNTLQLNQGFVRTEKDSTLRPVFSEIAYFSGIAQTDWSWSPLLTDLDNDGYRDLIISNGLPKDMSDLDFMAYRSNAVARTPIPQMLMQMPVVKVSNYVYRNNGQLQFEDMTKAWGLDFDSFGAGMASADFDRDGDIDIIINNTNEAASLLENTAAQQKEKPHYLQISLASNKPNHSALGAWISIYYGGNKQVYEYTPYRGYMSSIESIAHFGIGKNTKIDSVVVIWPDHKQQTFLDPAIDQRLHIQEQSNATSFVFNNSITNPIFKEISRSAGLEYLDMQEDFIDFNIQKLIPHKLSQYGPSLAAGDINGDGLHDLIVGAGSPDYATIFMQRKNGQFIKELLTNNKEPKYQDDAGLCLFDADADGDLDLYIASGGGENPPQHKAYADHFYLNNGKGQFTEVQNAVPDNRTTKSCVKANDFDADGDLDLFIGGRFIPGRYPAPASSILLRNDCKPGQIKFTDITQQTAPQLQQLGMVTDAIWSDANNDGKAELFITTEWGGIEIFAYANGSLQKQATALQTLTGWWNSITAADLDNDGDIDYVVGNYGGNGYIKASQAQPASIYAKDFDQNSSYDAVISHYQLSKIKGEIKEFPVAGRDDFLKEMTIMKERFPNYGSYAKTSMQEIFGQDGLKDAYKLSATELSSGWIENTGNFTFTFHALPPVAQLAPIYGILVQDINNDGWLDLILNGNEFSMTPALGRNDALNSLVLLGDGKKFSPLPITQSGLYIAGNGKALAALAIGNRYCISAVQNNGPLKSFITTSAYNIIPLTQEDKTIDIALRSGKKRKQEIYWGSGFLSQTPNMLIKDKTVVSITITNSQGQKRTIQ
ncbi:MAG: FG-GAP-like repeat-containing protein [Chitinophagaceae bacterium]|nr:FG-GAP-like repeat-containing protein [Chitinophagaceae bacterium]